MYDGTLKVGEAIVQSSGVYGYTEPTKQKLVVGEAENELTFTIQTNGINEGVETKGVNPITHPSFVSGDTVNKNLAFNTKTTTITPPTSGGGGGGGGSRKSKVTTPAAEPLVLGQTSTSTGTEEEQRIQLQKQLIALLTQIIALLQLKMAL